MSRLTHRELLNPETTGPGLLTVIVITALVVAPPLERQASVLLLAMYSEGRAEEVARCAQALEVPALSFFFPDRTDERRSERPGILGSGAHFIPHSSSCQ